MSEGRGIRGMVRQLLTVVALRQSDPGFGSTEIPTTLQRPFPTDVKTFQCPDCKGIKRARYGPVCLGVDGKHATLPARMKTADSTAGPDTPRLRTR